jgi:hypothetical protein
VGSALEASWIYRVAFHRGSYYPEQENHSCVGHETCQRRRSRHLPEQRQKTQSGSVVGLGSYFAKFYATQEYLLIASGLGLLRFSPSGEVLWKTSGLALDGVVVKRVDENRVTGEGEWDPPSGWKPFVLRLDSGDRIVD